MPSRYRGKIEDEQNQHKDTDIPNNIDVTKSSGGGVLQVSSKNHVFFSLSFHMVPTIEKIYSFLSHCANVIFFLQGSASECVFVCMLAARAQAIKRLKKIHPFVEEGVLLSKLMAYCSREAHSCVEKGAMMAFVKLRILEPDEKNSLRGITVRQVSSKHLKTHFNILPSSLQCCQMCGKNCKITKIHCRNFQ